MNTPRSGQAPPRGAAGPLVVAGAVVGCLGVLALLWAASPALEIAGGAVTDHLGPLRDWKIPAWLGKLIFAAVLLAVSGLLLAIGGGRWLVGTLRSARDRRNGQAGAEPTDGGHVDQLGDGRQATLRHTVTTHQEFAPDPTYGGRPNYLPYPPTQPLAGPAGRSPEV